jgi:dihydrofolate synthase/folylpolyglutamate synthase
MHSVCERIQINRENIPKDAFVHWTNHLRNTLDDFSPGQRGFTTFFELITAMGFLYFQEEQVDFAVIETGLGGRLDATNVADPKLCIITHISMEHADKQSPVVVGHQDHELLHHFHARLDDHSAKVVMVDERYELLSTTIASENRHILCKCEETNMELISPLLGYYQTQNVMTAHASMSLLFEHGIVQNFNDDTFNQGLQKTKWDGRFEIITHGKTKVVFDIAHTVKGAASLKKSLEEAFPHANRIYVMGFLHDKNVPGMINALCNDEDQIYFTIPPTPRALPMDQLKEQVQKMNLFSQHYFEDDVLNAFDLAIQNANDDDVVIVAGSLYLVSSIREKIIQQMDK